MESVCQWSEVIAEIGTDSVYSYAIDGFGVDHVCVARWLRADRCAQAVAARNNYRGQAGFRGIIALLGLVDICLNLAQEPGNASRIVISLHGIHLL